MTPAADPHRDGFVFVPVAHDGTMAHAEPGRTVRIPARGPSWIAVDHQLASILVARWPGRLWAVEIVDPTQPRILVTELGVGYRLGPVEAVRHCIGLSSSASR